MMPAGRMISCSVLASIRTEGPPPWADDRVPTRRVARAARVRATGEHLPRFLDMRSRAGPCRPSASVTRREKAGQTRSDGAICSRAGATGGSGGQPLYCASCDPTTHARVSLRDRRDTRSHTDHLLCHPDVHRPTVQGPAAIDGAHAGARPVRPGRQAHAALRHVQARRYRRVQAAARLRGPGGRHAVHQARHRPRRRHGRDPRRQRVHQRDPAQRGLHLRRSPTRRPSRRPCRATSTAGSSRRASSS